MDPGTIGALAAAIAVPLFFAVMRKVAPLGEAAEIDPRRLQELAKKYLKYDLLGVVLILGGAAALGFAWYQGLAALAGWWHRDLAGVHVIRPPREIWILVALFLGLISTPLVIDPVMRLVLGSRYAEYMAYERAKAGFNPVPVLVGLIVVVVLGVGTIAVFGLDFYTVFEEDQIVIDRFAGFAEERRPYATIRKIDWVTDPKRPHFRVEFEDGSRWTTKDGGRTTEPGDATAIEYAASRAGVAIGQAAPD